MSGHILALGNRFWPLFLRFVLNFGSVLMVWYVLFFMLLSVLAVKYFIPFLIFNFNEFYGTIFLLSVTPFSFSVILNFKMFVIF
jgi:hypothetical protein